MNYLQQIEDSFQLWAEISVPESKQDYVGNYIFDITTYDGGEGSALDLLTKDMLEICKVILDRTNFDYIADESNYVKYMTMINFPFLKDNLEWGTSIRGAWFDNDKRLELDCGRIIVEKGEIGVFIEQIFIWLNQ